MRFDQKCALVTGAGSGIGRAVCVALAREGADVAVADVSGQTAEATSQEVRKAGRKAVALLMDVTEPESVQAAFRVAASQLGRIDILVNSAGVREIVPFLELPFAEWQRVIATNLTGTFLCSQVFAKHLVSQGRGGKIVNMTSVAGVMAVPNRAAYVSSKHAIVGLTKELAMELGDKNIQVNAVAPGVVETAMTSSYFANPALVASLKKVHPAGRWGQPEEIAALILFLASDQAGFITGTTVLIDGGFAAGKGF